MNEISLAFEIFLLLTALFSRQGVHAITCTGSSNSPSNPIICDATDGNDECAGEEYIDCVVTCRGGCSSATFTDSLVICLPPVGYGSCIDATFYRSTVTCFAGEGACRDAEFYSRQVQCNGADTCSSATFSECSCCHDESCPSSVPECHFFEADMAEFCLESFSGSKSCKEWDNPLCDNVDIPITPSPTKNPTPRPTENPTLRPTNNPTRRATAEPTQASTNAPTKSPTSWPTQDSRPPTSPPMASQTPPPTSLPSLDDSQPSSPMITRTPAPSPAGSFADSSNAPSSPAGTAPSFVITQFQELSDPENDCCYLDGACIDEDIKRDWDFCFGVAISDESAVHSNLCSHFPSCDATKNLYSTLVTLFRISIADMAISTVMFGVALFHAVLPTRRRLLVVALLVFEVADLCLCCATLAIAYQNNAEATVDNMITANCFKDGQDNRALGNVEGELQGFKIIVWFEILLDLLAIGVHCFLILNRAPDIPLRESWELIVGVVADGIELILAYVLFFRFLKPAVEGYDNLYEKLVDPESTSPCIFSCCFIPALVTYFE